MVINKTGTYTFIVTDLVSGKEYRKSVYVEVDDNIPQVILSYQNHDQVRIIGDDNFLKEVTKMYLYRSGKKFDVTECFAKDEAGWYFDENKLKQLDLIWNDELTRSVTMLGGLAVTFESPRGESSSFVLPPLRLVDT